MFIIRGSYCVADNSKHIVNILGSVQLVNNATATVNIHQIISIHACRHACLRHRNLVHVLQAMFLCLLSHENKAHQILC